MIQRFRRLIVFLKSLTFWVGHVALILAYMLFLRPLAWIARIKWRISRFTARFAIRWGRTPGFAALAIMIATFSSLYMNFDIASAGISGDDELTRSLSMSDDDISSASSFAVGGKSTGQANAQGSSSNSDGMAINQQQALLLNKLLLEKACANLTQFGDYTAKFYKHERVQGTLLDPQVMEIKVREKPFSVYMRWLVGDKGRELLYVNGKNDNNLLVHPGGWQGNLVSALSISRDSNLAMSENRYPIDKVGMLELAKILISYRERDLAGETGARVTVMDERTFEGYDCYRFIVEYDDRERSPDYRKSIVMIDKEHCLPVYCQNYTWPEEGVQLTGKKLDEATLLEFYTYTDVKIGPQLADKDFDRNNEGYQFH